MEAVVEELGRVSLDEEKKREEFQPVEIALDKSMVDDLFNSSGADFGFGGWISYKWEQYSLDRLKEYSNCYQDIKTEFNQYFDEKKEVVDIEYVRNPFLYIQYALKLKHKQLIHGEIKENRLYHGTKSCNIPSICRENFNWRKLGANGFRSSKFGQGVSFSPSAEYASDYPRRCYEDPRVMILAKVLEVSRCEGDDSMEIPPVPHDTSADLQHQNVVVKYFDNEFYPDYVIYYRDP